MGQIPRSIERISSLINDACDYEHSLTDRYNTTLVNNYYENCQHYIWPV